MWEVDQPSKVVEASKTMRDQAQAFEQASRRARGECRRLLGKTLGGLSVTRSRNRAQPVSDRGDDEGQGCDEGYRNHHDHYFHDSLDDAEEEERRSNGGPREVEPDGGSYCVNH